MNEVILQGILAVSLFVVTAIISLIPIKIINYLLKDSVDGELTGSNSWIMSLLSCFTGGVFFATVLLDIFPHINEGYSNFKAAADIDIDFPMPEFISICGFMLVYLIEEVCLKLFKNMGLHGHSHEEPEKMRRSVSMSRGGPSDFRHLNALAKRARRRSSAIADKEENSTYVLENKLPKFTELESIDEHPNVDEEAKSVTGSTTEKTSDPSINSKSDLLHKRRGTVYSIASAFKPSIFDDPDALYVMPEDLPAENMLKGITFTLIISLHSVLEGFALGVQDRRAGIFSLFVSLAIHKSVEAFSVGLQVAKSNSKRRNFVIVTVLLYALATPIGCIIGVILKHADFNEIAKDGLIFVLESLAAGTFLYVTFFEILAQEKANEFSNLVQLIAIFSGFMMIALVQLIEAVMETGHSHGGGEHGHHHEP
uniref:Zinc/iron permease n=1 Tax=Rhabditophanes sp. KR3021 TaxID=114890 RepID=A0AC35TPI0_9BILA